MLKDYENYKQSNFLNWNDLEDAFILFVEVGNYLSTPTI